MNDSNANGHWTIEDDTVIKAGFILPNRTGAVPSSSVVASANLTDPIAITTNIRITQVTGLINIAGFILGYEEPN